MEHQIEDAPHRHYIIVWLIHVAGLTHQAKRRKYPAKVNVLVPQDSKAEGARLEGIILDRRQKLSCMPKKESDSTTSIALGNSTSNNFRRKSREHSARLLTRPRGQFAVPPQRSTDQERSERQPLDLLLSPKNGPRAVGRQRKEAVCPQGPTTWQLRRLAITREQTREEGSRNMKTYGGRPPTDSALPTSTDPQ